MVITPRAGHTASDLTVTTSSTTSASSMRSKRRPEKRAAGTTAAEAAKAFKLPAALGEWTMFSGNYYEVALRAWERELGAV